ncbi:MAG: lipocalin family protein [Bacteroidota bacterium]
MKLPLLSVFSLLLLTGWMIACGPAETVDPNVKIEDPTQLSLVVGTWSIKRYSYIAAGKGALVEENAGTFEFDQDGTGFTDADVPGMRQANKANVKWVYDEEVQTLTLDFQNGEDPDVFEVLKLNEAEQILRREWGNSTQKWIIDIVLEK